MRLVTFLPPGATSGLHIGIHQAAEGVVVDLTASLPGCPPTMKGFLEGGEEIKAAAAAVVASADAVRFPLDAVTLKAPIYDAGKVICVGMNYVDHCTEQGQPIPKEPILFTKFASCIIAPGEPILLSPETAELDFEVELVIVIGKTGKRVAKEDAMSYVAGYTVAHDVSARDLQLKRNGGQWLLGKAMDAFAPIGPAIVTVDELGDPHALGIRCFLNGAVVQDSNTSQLVHKTEDIISYMTRFFTVHPGDIILTGTPPGVGCFRKPPLFLKPGDVVTCEIDGIGAITNTVVADTA